jgi:hypothetical protein
VTDIRRSRKDEWLTHHGSIDEDLGIRTESYPCIAPLGVNINEPVAQSMYS